MDKPDRLKRVCSSCGEPKPLSAFLHLTGTQGTTYGNICSDCRRMVRPKKASTEAEDRSTTTSGVRIGGKEKVVIHADRQRHRQGLQDLYKAEVKKRELLKNEKETLAERKLKDEKKHRYFMETKKRDFLGGAAKKLDTKKSTAGSQTTTPEQKAIIARIGEKARNITDVKQLETMIAEELRNTTVDLSQIFLDPQFSDLRHNNPMINNYIQWLGTGASFARARILKALEQFETPAPAAKKQFIDGKRSFLEKNKNEAQTKKEKERDPLSDYIDKTWNPSSTRRR